jgi:hypothetical protein
MRIRIRQQVNATAVIAALASASAGYLGAASATSLRFYSDDPFWEEPNTQDASKVQPWDVDLAWDLVENLFTKPGDPAADTRAQNVNTVDEVPDGAWFTNRAGMQPLTAADVARGAGLGKGPAAGQWTVVSAKSDGITPGFTIRDREETIWFVKFDPPGYRGMATGTEMVVARLLWALGYHTPEYSISRLRIEELQIADGTRVTPPGAKARQMTRGDLEWLVRDADRDADGSYRVSMSKALPGKPVGPFRFYDTRPDDPNDVFPHEHRRELRGYGVFAAWFNHVDAKSINTFDTLITEKGRTFVRHYLLDFGSTLGSAAVYPRESWEGREYLVEPGNLGKGILGFGFYGLGKRMTPVFESPAIGRIDRDNTNWDPEEWKPRIPNPAFLRARADDKFWAARRATAISDEMIHAAVGAGQFGNPEAEMELERMLRQRRDAIVRRYLPAINPVSDPALDSSGTLSFKNAAVEARVANAPASYEVAWFAFDNATSAAAPIGTPMALTGEQGNAPPGVPTGAGSFVRVSIKAVNPPHPSWAIPVHAYFQRIGAGWKLVGFERLPDEARPRS